MIIYHELLKFTRTLDIIFSNFSNLKNAGIFIREICYNKC